MKNLIILFIISNTCIAQVFKNEYLLKCKIKSDSIIFNNAKKLYKISKVNFDDSYFLFTNNNYEKSDESKLYKIIKVKSDSLSIFHNKNYSFNKFCMFYDINYNSYKIGNFQILFDEKGSIIINNQLKEKLNLYENLLKGKLLNFNTTLKIAKYNGFTSIFSFDLEMDPRWKGPDFYEDNEKRWKITWIIKEKNIINSNKIFGFKVIKIDAKNGKILSIFKEYPID